MAENTEESAEEVVRIELPPLRVCDLCGGVDNHPRHVLAGTNDGVFQPGPGTLSRVLSLAPEDERERLVRDLMDTTSSDRHLQCCAEAGCPTGECPVWVEGSEDKIGDEFREHIMSVREARIPLIMELHGIEQQGD